MSKFSNASVRSLPSTLRSSGVVESLHLHFYTFAAFYISSLIIGYQECVKVIAKRNAT